jgi:hypothetical protein
MTEDHFRAIYRELIDENPLAIRAVLKVLHVEFTDRVPTLAVTCEERPRLLVNLGFLEEHCKVEAHVKAVLCHEFLHVLLRHTDRAGRSSDAEHLALDAVINAIIHRSAGPEYSGMMSRYYADARGVARLLRPPTDAENYDVRRVTYRPAGQEDDECRILAAWGGLYAGRLVADDIRDLARDLVKERGSMGAESLLGNHDALDGPAGGATPFSGPLATALDDALKCMNGTGVFRSPAGLGVSAYAREGVFREADAAVERWRQETYAVLRRHLAPDARAAGREAAPRSFTLPVLSPGDRRAALRALWSPLLPDAHWNTEIPKPVGSAQVYLDVSGSMHAEMPLIVALLGRLSRYIRRPFWAFSNLVAPARLEQGRLVADTTGGTSMSCVLEHVARTRPSAAVVVTDGYIEPLEAAQVAATKGTRLHAIVTRDGNARLLARAGLPYTQLSRLPS